jgi:uncharacterized protein (DUF1800 family)
VIGVARALVPALIFFTSLPALAGMGLDEARHLLGRTGFAPTANEIRDTAALTREQAVTRLLAGARTEARTAPPAWIDEPVQPLRDATPEQRRELLQREFARGVELRSWWLTEMLGTPSPLTERMTLFWHGHFTSSQQKVRFSQLMYRQNVLLRRHALGNFGELLHQVSKDPAMVVYLDSATNRKGHPNENFAREVMELFTLGEGQYSETDVREAARAFTGWSIDPDTREFRWRPAVHDSGDKTLLGRSGDFDGDEALDVLLAQPQTAIHIVDKLWREFVSPKPDRVEVERIARVFRESGYDIPVALRGIFLSSAFWAAENRGALVKSPAELVVGTLRSFQVDVSDPMPFAFLMAGLGQNLFGPPNVKGWPGGETWINSSTLLARKQFVERLFRSDEQGDMQRVRLRDDLPAKGLNRMGPEGRQRMTRALTDIRFDASRWLGEFTKEPSLSRPALSPQLALLPLAPVSPLPARVSGRELARAITLDPVYQLK